MSVCADIFFIKSGKPFPLASTSLTLNSSVKILPFASTVGLILSCTNKHTQFNVKLRVVIGLCHACK